MTERAVRVFISRDLSPDSPFQGMLAAEGFRVTGRSLLAFTPRAGWQCPPCDWVFFSSPRAVSCFFRNLPAPGLSSDVRLAAIGPGTAEALRDQGRRVDFSGSGHPDEAAKAFLALAEGHRVVFPRARRSRRSVQQRLADRIRATDIVVYENVPTGEVPAGPFDVLVFTSPLNAEAWKSGRGWSPGQRLVAIGQTTAQALERLGAHEVVVAGRPTEAALADAVLRAWAASG